MKLNAANVLHDDEGSRGRRLGQIGFSPLGRRKSKGNVIIASWRFAFGAQGGDRTPDQLGVNEPLYR